MVSLLLSVVFFLLAFFIGLPAFMIRPHKFALTFTLGSFFFMGSFAMLKVGTAHRPAEVELVHAVGSRQRARRPVVAIRMLHTLCISPNDVCSSIPCVFFFIFAAYSVFTHSFFIEASAL